MTTSNFAEILVPRSMNQFSYIIYFSLISNLNLLSESIPGAGTYCIYTTSVRVFAGVSRPVYTTPDFWYGTDTNGTGAKK